MIIPYFFLNSIFFRADCLNMKKYVLLIFMAIFSLFFAFSAEDMLIHPEDIRIVYDKGKTFSSASGYHLYIRKKSSIESVMLVETTKDPEGKEDNYAYRSLEYNKINGDEIRYLNGSVLDSPGAKYPLMDSTVEADPVFGEAFHILKLCDDQQLVNTIGEVIGYKAVQLDPATYNFDFTKYLSMDIVKQHKVIPFEINENRIKIAFADPSNKDTQKMVRLILLNKGLSMDVFVTFETYIDTIVKNVEAKMESDKDLDSYGKDVAQLVDNIIRSAMTKRASVWMEGDETPIVLAYLRIEG